MYDHKRNLAVHLEYLILQYYIYMHRNWYLVKWEAILVDKNENIVTLCYQVQVWNEKNIHNIKVSSSIKWVLASLLVSLWGNSAHLLERPVKTAFENSWIFNAAQMRISKWNNYMKHTSFVNRAMSIHYSVCSSLKAGNMCGNLGKKLSYTNNIMPWWITMHWVW